MGLGRRATPRLLPVGAGFSLLGPVFEAVAETGDWARVVRSVIGDDVPPGIVVVRIDKGRRACAPTSGPPGPRSPGHTVAIDVVVDSAADKDTRCP